MNKRQPVPIVQGDMATRLTSASRKPLSEAEIEALIKARLKAEDAATMQRPAKVDPRPKQAGAPAPCRPDLLGTRLHSS